MIRKHRHLQFAHEIWTMLVDEIEQKAECLHGNKIRHNRCHGILLRHLRIKAFKGF